MKAFWYLMTVLFGALGALSLLRVLEQLVFEGGKGPLAMQAGMGVGFVMLAGKALAKARAPRRPSRLQAEAPRPD